MGFSEREMSRLNSLCLKHSTVVLGKNDDLNSSVLQRGTVLSTGRCLWYGFNSDTREDILGTGYLLFYDTVIVYVFFFFLLENRTLIPRTIFDDLFPLLHQ